MILRGFLVISIFSQLWAFCLAGFQNSFNNVTRGSDLLLQWNSTNATDYPLVIRSRLINQTSEYGANSLEVNITIGLNASSFLWKTVPYPLPYLETSKYEVEVLSQNWVESETSVSAFAFSPYFTIAESEEDTNEIDPDDPFNKPIIIPSKPTNQPAASNGVNNNTAIAAGLVVPVVVILAVFGFVWMQQRQKRILEEKRKHREELYID
ncbi:uncharacterized protein F4822DRAFT_213628 [Hypoxylon trugodes]|uniref:uncharacterized protein n=1 Tax=Hypoxylon trugodes TaxID=326681 RepID=UPI002199E01B|nr:uncharacterized protein F4822DRAFT_213628 [Hypoxylon trugodes]KAI1389787.1 hypothetical protein F4822DRAFT_213628 [Hypoxylon trugodes]